MFAYVYLHPFAMVGRHGPQELDKKTELNTERKRKQRNEHRSSPAHEAQIKFALEVHIPRPDTS